MLDSQIVQTAAIGGGSISGISSISSLNQMQYINCRLCIVQDQVNHCTTCIVYTLLHLGCRHYPPPLSTIHVSLYEDLIIENYLRSAQHIIIIILLDDKSCLLSLVRFA